MAKNIDEARAVARTLLDELETENESIAGLLMKAKRLARLTRDSDAQTWLDLELRGYPSKFNFSTIGSCQKYAIECGRRTSEGKYYTTSLPQLEATCRNSAAMLASFPTVAGGGAPTVPDFIAKNATRTLLQEERRSRQEFSTAHNNNVSLFSALRSGIHSYVTDTFIAIELGDIAQDIFASARTDVDSFIRSYCPKAAEQLVAINERMAEKTPESWSAALTTCRRLLMTVADSLFPARDTDWLDPSGRPRKVGTEQYKNRLLAYLQELKTSGTSHEIVSAGIEHLAARLDAIYEKVCKGVHVAVTEQEARLAVIHTYLFIGEIASGIANANPSELPVPASESPATEGSSADGR